MSAQELIIILVFVILFLWFMPKVGRKLGIYFSKIYEPFLARRIFRRISARSRHDPRRYN